MPATPHILPHLSIDCAVFGYRDERLNVLLIQREEAEGRWALPGGYLHEDESLEDAARRVLESLTGLRSVYLEQLHTFGQLDRYPGKRVVTVAYYALIHAQADLLRAGHDAQRVCWHDHKGLPPLVFDHPHILAMAYDTLKARLRTQPIGFELLPPKFTLSDIHRLYEVILDRPLDKPNFRRKLDKMKLLVPLEERQQGVAHRAARLYRFDPEAYERLQQQGFMFEV